MTVLRTLLRPLRGRVRRPAADAPPVAHLTPAEVDQINPILRVQDGATEVAYCTPNRHARWRAETLITKEPDTIEWWRRVAARCCAIPA